MAVPDFQSILLPLLQFAGDGQEHSLREAIETLAKEFNLTDAERRELLPSGRQATFDNRVGWARTYMKKAGLLRSPRRGCFEITERGLEVLDKKPPRIDIAYLRQFPDFVEFQTAKRKTDEKEKPKPEDGDTLAQLMIDFDIGVSGVASYELKRVDIDYFTKE